MNTFSHLLTGISKLTNVWHYELLVRYILPFPSLCGLRYETTFEWIIPIVRLGCRHCLPSTTPPVERGERSRREVEKASLCVRNTAPVAQSSRSTSSMCEPLVSRVGRCEVESTTAAASCSRCAICWDVVGIKLWWRTDPFLKKLSLPSNPPATPAPAESQSCYCCCCHINSCVLWVVLSPQLLPQHTDEAGCNIISTLLPDSGLAPPPHHHQRPPLEATLGGVEEVLEDQLHGIKAWDRSTSFPEQSK
jgi:hypothetical protein